MKKTTPILIVIALFVIVFASACGGAAAPQASEEQAPAAGPAPDVKDTEPGNTYCVEKIPYQNISVDSGTTFEALDPKGELKCQDSGTVVDGKTVLTCTGKQLWTYDLKLTGSSGGSTTIKVNMGACP
jgi:hypothetical protein